MTLLHRTFLICTIQATKVNQAKKFLRKGLRVKFTLFYKRNQPRDPAVQKEVMQGLIDGVAGVGKEVEGSIAAHGKANMSVTVEPV